MSDENLPVAHQVPPPGTTLSAMERAVTIYRKRIAASLGDSAINTRSAGYRVDGFRDGWQACLDFLRSNGGR